MSIDMSIDMSWTVWMRLNSVTLACNIIPFQAMSVFCRCIKGMLRSKFTDDGYIYGQPSMKSGFVERQVDLNVDAV